MALIRSVSWLGLAAAALLGAAVGVGSYTAGYAEALSYLRDDPSACANCHVMQGHLDAWAKSSHSDVAGCNDCHAPHGSLVEKYASKARNGFFHSLAFTTGDYPANLRVTAYNRHIAEGACRSCHSALTHTIDRTDAAAGDRAALECTRCHAKVGHDF